MLFLKQYINIKMRIDFLKHKGKLKMKKQHKFIYYFLFEVLYTGCPTKHDSL